MTPVGSASLAISRRTLLKGLSAFTLAGSSSPTHADQLVGSARAQIGVTLGYDPAYRRLAYPGGDVPRATGVCADVIIRAYRDALALDLQRLLHDDLARSFAAYPHTWGLAHPDPNIDQRRVPNLETFWRRAGAELWLASAPVPGDAFPAPLRAGDLVTWRLGGRLPHVAIVSSAGAAPQVVHNIGYGAQEVPLAGFGPHRAHGHYRWALG